MQIPSHEAHFAQFEPDIRARLEDIQAEVERVVPGAERCMGYQMPAFRKGRTFFYFSAFKKHIGVFPPVHDDEALVAETARYRGPKGNLQFKHKDPLPVELIGRVARALAEQYGRD